MRPSFSLIWYRSVPAQCMVASFNLGGVHCRPTPRWLFELGACKYVTTVVVLYIIVLFMGDLKCSLLGKWWPVPASFGLWVERRGRPLFSRRRYNIIYFHPWAEWTPTPTRDWRQARHVYIYIYLNTSSRLGAVSCIYHSCCCYHGKSLFTRGSAISFSSVLGMSHLVDRRGVIQKSKIDVRVRTDSVTTELLCRAVVLSLSLLSLSLCLRRR